MAIELSGIVFPEKSDLVVGVSGEEEILDLLRKCARSR